MNTNCRNTNIEILRLLLISGICLWHILMHGFGLKQIGYENAMILPPPGISAFLCALLAPATYCFMFISGYYGMRFSISKTVSLIYMALFCFASGLFIKYLLFGTIDLGDIARHFFPISTGRWWFLTGYMMVYLVSPFINKGIKEIQRKDFVYLLLLMTGLEVFSIITLKANAGSNFYGLLYIYVLGRYTKKYDIRFKQETNILVYTGCLTILSFLLYMLFLLPSPYNKLFFIALGYNNPLIIIMAITLFFIIKDMRPRYNLQINAFLSPILYVYLLTETIGEPLYQYEAMVCCDHPIYGVALVIAIIVSCMVIGHLGNMIFHSINS